MIWDLRWCEQQLWKDTFPKAPWPERWVPPPRTRGIRATALPVPQDSALVWWPATEKSSVQRVSVNTAVFPKPQICWAWDEASELPLLSYGSETRTIEVESHHFSKTKPDQVKQLLQNLLRSESSMVTQQFLNLTFNMEVCIGTAAPSRLRCLWTAVRIKFENAPTNSFGRSRYLHLLASEATLANSYLYRFILSKCHRWKSHVINMEQGIKKHSISLKFFAWQGYVSYNLKSDC